MKTKLILIMATAVSLTGCGFNGNAGDGQRTGTPISLTKKGLFCKTWECEIIKGGMSGGSGGFGQPFWFTCQSDIQAQQIQQAMDDNKEIKINYHSARFYSLFSSGSGGDFLDSFTIVTNK